MILSHKYKYLFIKNTKVAGTSIEQELSKYCGINDILTEFGGLPEIDKIYKSRNYIERGFYNHISLQEIKYKLKDNEQNYINNRYYKFCIERNPQEKVVSQFWMKLNRLNIIKNDFDIKKIKRLFNQHIKEKTWLMCKDQHRYTINDEIAVNKVIQYDNLEQEFIAICKNLYIPITKINTYLRKYKTVNYHFTEYYTKQTRDLIGDHFSKEITTFNYKFK